MTLLRVYVVVLMAGWLAWLVVDKSPPSPGTPGTYAGPPFALPPAGRPTHDPTPLPPREGTMLADFQYAVDMVKRGELRQGFVVLWRRQYLWVSAIVTGLVVFVLAPAVRQAIPRRRPAYGGGDRAAGEDRGRRDKRP